MSRATTFALVVLGVIGAGTLHGLSVRNGLFDLIDAHKIQGILPNGADEPYKNKFTGIGPVDSLLATLLLFFWPVVNGGSGNEGSNLLGVLFAGQSCAAMTMVLIEGMRKGNEGRAVSFIAIYSALIQTCGFAIAGPVYLTINVLTSPTFANPTVSSLIVSNVDAIPFGLILGFILPSIYMALPTPSILSLKAKIWAIMLWQPSPIYAIYISKGLSALSPHKAKTTSVPRQLMHLRAAYKFALLIAIPANIITWTVSLAAVFYPSLFTPQVAASLHPLRALIPQNPLSPSSAKAANIAQGSHWFLQWDYWITSSAYLIFAFAAKQKALRNTSLSDVVGTLGKVVLLGPMSAAVLLLWQRDELVLGKAEEKEGKKG